MDGPTCKLGTTAGGDEGISRAPWSDAGFSFWDIGGQRPSSRADLLFASEILRCLRDGLTPPQRALECSGFVEHWMIVARDDVCLLKGTVWRLPVSRHKLATPLLAIDPIAGWARAVDEWLTIRPCLGWVAAGIDPDGVADLAARWLERQLRAADRETDGIRQN
jgi:hypothetical protein